MASKLIRHILMAALLLASPAGLVHGDTTMHILAFGDSLTAGYGLPADQSFAAQLERRLRDMGRDVRVTNAGVSGDTTAGGLARLAWSLEDKPHLVVLELGANDGLRGLDPVRMRDNLDAMIRQCQEAGARIILAGMRAPVNWGLEYRKQFDDVFPELAEEHDLPLYPFFLEGVVRDPSLVLDDGLHPNAAGVARIVDGILPLVTQELDALEKVS
ncbi:arylesterase [Desulfomicrobium escambiense]|uniref:arylesterase n=1 Tax=Desulfomicrobium escambiense TaxID=29503 RepID=UPI00040DCCF7|nr:arylesterase [Desulfomicrobium escambiense]